MTGGTVSDSSPFLVSVTDLDLGKKGLLFLPFSYLYFNDQPRKSRESLP